MQPDKAVLLRLAHEGAYGVSFGYIQLYPRAQGVQDTAYNHRRPQRHSQGKFFCRRFDGGKQLAVDCHYAVAADVDNSEFAALKEVFGFERLDSFKNHSLAMKKIALTILAAAACMLASAQTSYTIQRACHPDDVKNYDTGQLRSRFMMPTHASGLEAKSRLPPAKPSGMATAASPVAA